MPNHFEMRQTGAVLVAALSAAFPSAGHAAGAAQVDFATGDVRALGTDGRSRPLAKGAEIISGETIDTGSGRAQVRFSDGAQVSLQPQTQFRIDDYRFSGKADGSEKGFFSLLKGGLRTITGLVGRSNRDNYKVTTTVATIGIRGTEYSVTYGNSINVTTGEGSNEVCNAAGCLILNSGETAYIADSNTKPVMTDKKAELPPPPVQEPIPQFIAGNDDNSGSAGLFPKLLSGPNYAAVFSYDGGVMSYSGGTATFDSSSQLVSFDGGEAFTATTIAGGMTDGVVGWGRWSSGDDCCGPQTNMHYVVGIPTPTADFSGPLAGVIGTYTLMGYTYPTGSDGTVGTGAVSGNLKADFSSSKVDLSLHIPIGAHSFDISTGGFVSSGSLPSINPSTSVTSLTGGCTYYCSSAVDGYFYGPNAVGAGLVYKIYSTTDFGGTVNGAVAFRISP